MTTDAKLAIGHAHGAVQSVPHTVNGTPTDGRVIMDKFDELVNLLPELRNPTQESRKTSLRLPADLHRALQIATELGMDDSLTAATTQALIDRVDEFVRREALARHYERFPEDIPELAGVAKHRVRMTDHPAVDHPKLVDEVAAWVEREQPDWPTSRDEYDPVDRVLDYVEVLATYPGARRSESA